VKILSIVRKTLLELIREPLLLGLLLGFPLVLLGFYYVAFGQTDQGLASYLTVLVINEDQGTSLDENRWRAGDELVEAIQTTEYQGQPVFNVKTAANRQTAEIALREHKAAVLIIIPPDFSERIVDAGQSTENITPTAVKLVGDPNSGDFVFARSFLDEIVRQFDREVTGQEVNLAVTYDFLTGTGTMSDFDFGVGGIIVFAIMFLIVATAQIMVRENVNGTLRRLRLTRTRSGDLLIGVTLALMVVAAAVIPLTYGSAVALGFRSNGSLLLAIGIGLMLTLSAIGTGLIVACFARNDGDAANLGSGAMVPLVFLSGALFPMPKAVLTTIAGQEIEIYDLLPTTHATEAMRRVLIFGEGIGAIGYELGGMTILSILLLAAGVILYRRLKMRRE
jgi:ABC-2 type transport system permease protein